MRREVLGWVELWSSISASRWKRTWSEDLSQVRPDWGHATNAICIVGRRWKTRGLFLDRRAFLVSYDPTQDDAGAAILSRILGAVVPVCSGINLEYYFSYVDSPGWGSGSKLPHNITGLLGVMDGAMSDLRTGLPWQMVEIHEPVRLLFVIEATPAALMSIMEKNAAMKTMVANRWVQLAAMDPATGQLSVYQDGGLRSAPAHQRRAAGRCDFRGVVHGMARSFGIRHDPRRHTRRSPPARDSRLTTTPHAVPGIPALRFRPHHCRRADCARRRFPRHLSARAETRGSRHRPSRPRHGRGESPSRDHACRAHRHHLDQPHRLPRWMVLARRRRIAKELLGKPTGPPAAIPAHPSR